MTDQRSLRQEAVAHLEAVRRNGFTIIPDVLTPAEVQRYRASVERLYATDPGVVAKRQDACDLFHVENLVSKAKLFENFFLNDRVYPIVIQLVGEDCVLKDVWSLGLPPGGGVSGKSGKVFGSLHIEDPYPLGSPVLSVITSYPLVDFTADNGSTRVVPGSHLWGRLPTAERPESEIGVDVRAGDCLMFVGSLWHATGVNQTQQIRSSMAACFGVPWVKPFFDFTRTLPQEFVDRLSDEQRRLFGFLSQPPYVERWRWDAERGCPRE
jgi:ectoine hydroxylase-related dioxygenase (phytanoyl-CoA dioxygenase family)